MSDITHLTELAFIGDIDVQRAPKRVVLLPDGYQNKGETYEQAVQRRENEHAAIIAKLNAKRALRGQS